MYMRAVTYRIVYLGVVSAGILLGAALRQSTVQAAPSADVLPAARAVAAERPVVTLATIHVQAVAPKPATLASRLPADGGIAAGAGAETGGGTAAGGIMAHPVRLDMPYYALGKLLPRVGKD